MKKYTGTVDMIMSNSVNIDKEIKQLKRSAKAASKMRDLFEQQVFILTEQHVINLDQIRLLKEQKKVIAKLGKIK